MQYAYSNLIRHSSVLTKKFPFINMSVIGSSIMGRDLICFKIGKGTQNVMFAAAFHGLEYLTSAVMMKFLFDYARSVSCKTELFGFGAEQIYGNVTLYVIPMVNPDGIDIAINGLDLQNKYHKYLYDTLGTLDYSHIWQANARGVDLNHNYDALWEPITSGAAPGKYGGRFPESEPETQAIVNLVKKIDFSMVIALHSQGEEIYYDFNNEIPSGALKLADEMAKASGYTVCRPSGTASFGGFKDWFISSFHKKGFTVEIGKGKNPLTCLSSVYSPAAKLMLCALDSF